MKDNEFKILIVDDSHSMRNMIIDFFKVHSQYQIFEAENGLDALDFLKNNEVHLIITDIVMPELDGLSLLKKMKYSKPEVPIIVVSGFDSLSNIETAFKYYAVKFFSKPFNWEQLKTTVKKSKSIYEATVMSKKIADVIDLSLRMRLDPSNSKLIRHIINKLVTIITELYVINYEQGTKVYVLLTEFFLLGKTFLKKMSSESFLTFTYTQENSTVQFSIEDPKNQINFKRIFEQEIGSMLMEDLKRYTDDIFFENEGKRILIKRKL